MLDLPENIELEPLPFEEAIEFFADKVPLAPHELFELAEEVRARAFTVARVSSMDVIVDVHKAVAKAIEAGETLADFKGRLGDMDIGRVICGGNLISGFAHSRDLIYMSRHLKQYFTEKKVLDTFWLCEQVGITATAVSAGPEPVEILQKYRKAGGKMEWVAPCYPKEDDYKTNIDFVAPLAVEGIR